MARVKPKAATLVTILLPHLPIWDPSGEIMRQAAWSSLICACLLVQAPAQSTDADMNKSIRQEEAEHSQIMHTMHFLTDVYGPRLTGSPNHKAAAEWAIRQMKDWGFQNAHLEPWDFGHVGWVNEQASGYVVAPIHAQVTFRVVAWTPSTKGAIRAQAFQMILPDKPTQQQLTDYLNSVKDQVKNK